MIKRNKQNVFCVLATLCVVAGAALLSAKDRKPPKPKSGFIKTPDKVKIHYLESGRLIDPSIFVMHPNPGLLWRRPTILFVPGWTMPAWIWEKQIEHFAGITRVVAMDPRCQGESSQTTDGLSPAARARDIHAVVEQLHLAPVVLVGWSMGVGEVASYIDQFGTKNIAGIVFVDDVPGADVPPAVYKDVMDFISGFVQDRRGNGEKFVRSFFKKPQPEEYLRRVVEASTKTPTNTAVALLVGKFGADLRPALKKIDKPTLIVAAKSGFLNLIRAIQTQIAGSRLEIFEDAGHAIFVDEAEHFNSLLEEFVLKLPRP